VALAAVGAIAFSGKAIIVKLAYRYGVDAVTLLMLRMLFALPFSCRWPGGAASARGTAPQRLSRARWWGVLGLGFCGYYLASYLELAGRCGPAVCGRRACASAYRRWGAACAVQAPRWRAFLPTSRHCLPRCRPSGCSAKCRSGSMGPRSAPIAGGIVLSSRKRQAH